MSKFKYNFNPIPTTKKQIITVIITIIIFLLIPSILKRFNISSKLQIIIRFIIILIGFAIIMLDNHKLVKQLKQSQKQQYLNHFDLLNKVHKYKKQEESFDYNTATPDARINHVLYSLIVSSNTLWMADFYVSCMDYSMDEIKEILSKFKFSDDFTNYLNNVVYNYKTSKSIGNYGNELENILLNRLFNTPIDDKLFDDKVVYNIYRNLRTWVEYDQSLNKYLLHYEIYTNKYGYQAWRQCVKYTYYKTEQAAWNHVNKVLINKKQEDVEYFEIRDISRNTLNHMMLYKISNGILPEPYNTINYYLAYMDWKGYYNLFKEEPAIAKNIINISKEYISEEYYNELVKLTLCNDNMEKYQEMDRYYWDNKDKIEKVKVTFLEGYKFKILQ